MNFMLKCPHRALLIEQVKGSPTLGDDALGKRGYDRGDLVVEAHKVVNTKTGTETSGLFYPKEGDRIVGLNYVSFRIPPNWLDIDPPTGAKSWNPDGRRTLWKDFIEGLWHRQVQKALTVQPSYIEFERGISGWLGTTWEPYGVSLWWRAAESEHRVFNTDMVKNANLLSGFGLCVDSRDWSLKYVHPGTVADRLGE
jgi:hypothetical protein